MKYVAARTILALAVTRRAVAFTPSSVHSCLSFTSASAAPYSRNTRRYMSSEDPPQITQVDKRGFSEILEDIENSSREESGYVVIDVVSIMSLLYRFIVGCSFILLF